MQTIPQPCKAQRRLGWGEPSGAGPGQEWVERGGWTDGGMGENGPSGPLFPPSRGFCFFNSVAIACRQLQQQGKASRILIVDWVGAGA